MKLFQEHVWEDTSEHTAEVAAERVLFKKLF